MAKIKSMSKLQEILTEKIEKSMNENVAETVRGQQQKKIMRMVYAKYENPKHDSSTYTRRYQNGGLISGDNIKSETERFRGRPSVRLSVRNVTKMSNENSYLTPLIVLGHVKHKANGGNGYSAYPRFSKYNDRPSYGDPRNFIGGTVHALEQNKSHVRSLKQGLKSQGLKVK